MGDATRDGRQELDKILAKFIILPNDTPVLDSGEAILDTHQIARIMLARNTRIPASLLVGGEVCLIDETGHHAKEFAPKCSVRPQSPAALKRRARFV